LLLLLSRALAGGASGQVTFENVTAKMGLTGVTNSAAAWGDFNNDGWVDLYDGRALWRNQAAADDARGPQHRDQRGGRVSPQVVLRVLAVAGGRRRKCAAGLTPRKPQAGRA